MGKPSAGNFLAFLCAAAVFASAFTPGRALAWGRDGHRAICMIAWEQVKEPARQNVFALLDIASEEEFVSACTWADEIMAARPDTAAWHRVTLPTDARTFDLGRDCSKPASCVIEQVKRQAAVLKSTAPKAQRADALRFLAHLIGDLHQPLNITLAGQLSPGQVSGMFHGAPSNLHAVWETGLIGTLVPPDKDPARVIFNAAAWTGRLYGADKKTPLEWANETLWITVGPATGYIGNPGGDFFGERYIRQNRPVALEQIDKAGVRLADILNEALP
jgi:nuclease S1